MMSRHLSLLPFAVWAGLALVRPLAAQNPSTPPDIADLDLEELARIKVTSVSRRPEPASEAAAAVFVITREDIRRSGASSLPEALRLAPGLQVARVTARDWSITARGFAEQSPNKLLVLIDGRAVYSPLFAGTFWDVQDVPLEDVDRIEVILGPGATLWGSNAVNGVINVITRRAQDTERGLAGIRVGTAEHVNATARWGVGLGSTGAVRAYGRYLDREPSRFEDGTEGEDDWRQGQGGFRLDVDPGDRDRVTVQGDLYGGRGGQVVRHALPTAPFTETVNDELHAYGANLLGRWSRRLGARSELQLQAYVDHTIRKVPASFGRVAVDILDLDLQHHIPFGARHDVLWGVGYRINSDSLSGTFSTALVPSARTTHLVTGFVQDEIALVPRRWTLTLGAKLEHNDFSGLELQPNVRVLWLPGAGHTVWTAVSRAVRIPSRLDTDVRFVAQVLPTTPPVTVRFDGNEDFDSEELIAWEAGFRSQLDPTLSVDASVYYNWYDRLRSVRTLAPVVENGSVVQPLSLGNDAKGDSYGGTLAISWHPTGPLRLEGSYTLLEMDVRARDDAFPGSVPNVNPGFNPKHQASLRSSLTLAGGVELDLAARYVGVLPTPRISDYLEADARLGWAVRPGLNLALVGHDLLSDQHAEFSSVPQREMQRRGGVQLEWHF